jgi:hypothetical protein
MTIRNTFCVSHIETKIFPKFPLENEKRNQKLLEKNVYMCNMPKICEYIESRNVCDSAFY